MGTIIAILGIAIIGFILVAVSSGNKVIEERKKEEERMKDPRYLEEKQLAFAKRQKTQSELDKQNVAYCPRCLSTSITLTNSKKGSAKRAVIGYALLGGTGSILGVMTNKNQERVCLKCGHKW